MSTLSMKSIHKTWAGAALAMSAALAVCVASPLQAATKTFQAPPDLLQLKPSTLPGYGKAQAACVSCHSAEYMAYQPPSAARPYWESMVKRMKLVFKAPLDDADIPVIVDYLAKTYGAEQGK
jgi:hypothetical protein